MQELMKCLQKRERVWLIFTDPFRQRVIVGVIIDYRQWDDKHRPALVNTRDRSLLLTVSLTLSHFSARSLNGFTSILF